MKSVSHSGQASQGRPSLKPRKLVGDSPPLPPRGTRHSTPGGDSPACSSSSSTGTVRDCARQTAQGGVTKVQPTSSHLQPPPCLTYLGAQRAHNLRLHRRCRLAVDDGLQRRLARRHDAHGHGCQRRRGVSSLPHTRCADTELVSRSLDDVGVTHSQAFWRGHTLLRFSFSTGAVHFSSCARRLHSPSKMLASVGCTTFLEALRFCCTHAAPGCGQAECPSGDSCSTDPSSAFTYSSAHKHETDGNQGGGQ